MNKQSPCLKIFILFLILFAQPTDGQGQYNLGQKADSLFNAKNYPEASIAFEDLVQNHNVNKENVYLKLAYIYEVQGDFLKAIYFLSELYEIKPSDKLFDRINKIAKENSYVGFERSELNFLLTLYKQYYIPIILILLALTIFGTYYYVSKKSSESPIKKRYGVLLIIFIIIALLVNNLPSGYQQGIVNRSGVSLRDAPSAGSKVVSSINEGYKINIIGQSDVWLKVLWQRDIFYVKEDDLWILGK